MREPHECCLFKLGLFFHFVKFAARVLLALVSVGERSHGQGTFILFSSRIWEVNFEMRKVEGFVVNVFGLIWRLV